MMPRIIKISAIIMFSVALSACMNTGSVSYKQARMLKKEGFVLENEGWTLALPERLLFSFDDSSISEEQKPRLSRLANQLTRYDLEKVKFTGHTDNVGQQDYNLRLSEKRAQSVAYLFMEYGFKAQNVQTIGKGSSQPLVSNDSDENRAINRRVNITIIP